jgi:amino acid adenylation domain-containing protein
VIHFFTPKSRPYAVHEFFMNWSQWHKDYDTFSSLQERLKNVRAQIAAALDEFPPGAIRVVSLCAGDGRDLLGALENHARQSDVSARLLDNDAESVARGKKWAEEIGLAGQLHFLEADAALAKNYSGAVPADLVLLSGFLGHLRHEDVAGLIENLPMFCKTAAQVIWNRHQVLHDGEKQVPLILEYFRKANFSEIFFATSHGFAVGRARFIGQPQPLDPSRVLFEFVGLDKFLSAEKKPEAEIFFNPRSKANSKTGILLAAETSISVRFRQIAESHPARTALAGETWQPTYAELDSATDQLADVLMACGKSEDRVALLMRQDAPLIAAALAILKTGKIVVVLNPTDPPARLKQIFADADPVLIVTDLANENLARQIAEKNEAVLVFEKINFGPAKKLEIQIEPAAVAWLIYTSGTTGNPKGVMQTHRNIIHNVLRLSRGMELTADDRVMLLGSPSGGQGVSTMWCALLNGAALLPFPAAEKGIAGLKQWMPKNKISIFVGSTSVFRSFIKTLGGEDFFPDVRLVRFGSETATTEDFAAVKKYFPDCCVLLNSFSSSETGNITQQRILPDEHFAETRLPVGWPADGMEIFLLDESGREIRDGETGEIFAQSFYLSPGYWRNPSLTAERFLGNGDAHGLRVFRSGDLGQRQPDGSLRFMDRKDSRLKIHGYRIEISEIENAMNQQPDVEQAVASARLNSNGENQLLAHIVLRDGKNLSPENLRRALREILPGHIIPGRFIFLEKFPLTPHGKIDRQKLLEINPQESPTTFSEKPATLTEILVADIWQKVFGRSFVGRYDNFFDLGGDSLNAAVVAAQIFAARQIEPELRLFAAHPTLAQFAAAIDDLAPAKAEKIPAQLTRASRDGPLPLSFSQERIWKQSQTAQGSLSYVVARNHRICGPLDIEKLRQSMDFLVRRHEILRTTFDEIAGTPRPIIHPPVSQAFKFHDASEKPDPETMATEIIREEKRQGVDFRKLPLLRFVLIKIRTDEHWLLRIHHHLIFDAWSWKIYFQELGELYEAGLRGDSPGLPEFAPLQYVDFAAQQRNKFNPAEPAYEKTLAWWSRLFAHPPRPLKLPFRRFWRSRRAMPADALIRWGINPSTSQRLEKIRRETGATYFVVRLAAFAALVSPRARGQAMFFLIYITGRNRVELQNMFGDFVNLAMLRLKCDPAQTFRDWLQSVQQAVHETHVHSEIPYEQLCLDLRRRGVALPATQITFSIAEHTAPVKFGGLEIISHHGKKIEFMPWGFSLYFDQHNETANCVIFNAKIFHPARVQKWTEQFARFLEEISQHPNLPVKKLLALTSQKNKFF